MKNHTREREHLHIRSILQPPLPAKKNYQQNWKLRRPNTRSATAQPFGYSFFVTAVKAQLNLQVIT
jgi:hypothetical protein